MTMNSLPNVEIGPAEPEDLPVLMNLLYISDLPLAGFENQIETMVAARRDGKVVGCAALQECSSAALLRSVAVASLARGQGVGARLVESALALARQRGIEEVYLLTTTAESFFERLGFRRTSRSEVPPSIKKTEEFQELCPESATVMVICQK